MKYMLLINTDGDATPPASEEEAAAEMKRWFDYTDELGEAGVLAAGEALDLEARATTVTRPAGTTTDGPYAETKEAIGGFYLLDVADRDEAVRWATKMPGSGTVDVVPCVDFEAAG